MNPTYDYNLIVIGAGIAGMVSAVTANGLGKRVVVIEKNKVGGNCTNSTCIPNKALIRLSHLSHNVSLLRRLSLLTDEAGEIHGRKIMPHILRIIQRAYEKDLSETFEGSAAMEQCNENYLGGGINGGLQDLSQLRTRPVASLNPYRTSAKNIYLCSSSTPPGGGVHGLCGYYAAQSACK